MQLVLHISVIICSFMGQLPSKRIGSEGMTLLSYHQRLPKMKSNDENGVYGDKIDLQSVVEGQSGDGAEIGLQIPQKGVRLIPSSQHASLLNLSKA